MSFFIFMLTILILGELVCIMMLYRNNKIYMYQRRALEIVSNKASEAIKRNDFAWQRFYDAYKKYGDYDDMMNNHLFKWKFEDFYPNIMQLK